MVDQGFRETILIFKFFVHIVALRWSGNSIQASRDAF